MPWPLFLALVRRVSRFDHRLRLQLLDSVSEAVAALFSKEGGTNLRLARDELFRGAYPVDREGPAMALIQSRPPTLDAVVEEEGAPQLSNPEPQSADE